MCHTHHAILDDSSIALAALAQPKTCAVQLKTHGLQTHHITTQAGSEHTHPLTAI